MSATASHSGFRSLGRSGTIGVMVTLLVHASIIAVIYESRISEARPEAVRDLMVTKLVTFGKPREKFWLPRIVEPPKPKIPDPVVKVAENPLAPPAPKEPKEAPKPKDAEISKDLKHALDRARMLTKAAKEEPEEGSLTGSREGTSSQAEEGDAYATEVERAIKRNWNAPSGLLNDAQLAGLVAEVRIQIDTDGSLLSTHLQKRSGNQLFDDSCVQAVEATRTFPPPPPPSRAKFKRGVILEFAGKELAR